MMSKRSQSDKPKVRDAVSAIAKEERCGTPDALIAFGLRAVLAAMSRVPACQEQLVVKGGTALRLATGQPIGRVSTDLDLSLLEAGSSFDPENLTGEVTREIAVIIDEIYADSASVTIRLEADRTSPPYPQLPKLIVFRLDASADLGGRNPTRTNNKQFLIEIAVDEYVDRELLTILEVVTYGFPIRFQMYAPVQAIAEKLRALLQKLQHFERTGNEASFQPRHVLDLEFLFARLAKTDLGKLKSLFDAKCLARLVPETERTRERLLHPRLKSKVEEEAKRIGRSVASWQRLEELAAIVCPEK
jgi:hypothetical protein